MRTGTPRPIPALAGIGLRFPHLRDFERMRPPVGLLELHSENLFGLTPAVARRLEALRADYPMSLHGVGLSLGSANGLREAHLRRWAEVVRRYQPVWVSEHLCWNASEDASLPDLLPLPMNVEALEVVARNVEQVQERLGREIAVENISVYLRFEPAELTEAEFLGQLVRRTGCHLLVDLNNLDVNRHNLGEDPLDFLDRIAPESVAEFHLAGPTEAGGARIDTHATPVPEAVWTLFDQALRRFGAQPTVVEWDQDLPALGVLVAEAARAQARLDAIA